MSGETLVLKPEEARNIVEEAHDGFEVVEREVCDTSRWSVHYECIVKRLSDSKYFRAYYSEAATEMQSEEPFEYDDEVRMREVEEKEVVKKERVVV